MHTPLSAAAYDILSNPDGRIKFEGPFLKQLAGTGSVLDLACATGVHAEFLARWGAEVTARDLDPAMIDIAKSRRPHKRVQYQTGDMRKPPNGKFDLIMCIGNSLNMLPAQVDVQRTITAARQALAPGGKLLLHVLNPDSPARRQPTLSTKRGMVDGRPILILKAMVPHAQSRMISVAYFQPQDNCGNQDSPTWESSCHAASLLDLSQAQVKDFLDQAGFTGIQWHGGLDGSAFVPGGSPDLVCVAT